MSKNTFLEKYAKKQNNNSIDKYQEYLQKKNKILQSNQELLKTTLTALGIKQLLSDGTSFCSQVLEISKFIFGYYLEYNEYLSNKINDIFDTTSELFPEEEKFKDIQFIFEHKVIDVLFDEIDSYISGIIDIEPGTMLHEVRNKTEYSVKLISKLEEYLAQIEQDHNKIYLGINLEHVVNIDEMRELYAVIFSSIGYASLSSRSSSIICYDLFGFSAHILHSVCELSDSLGDYKNNYVAICIGIHDIIIEIINATLGYDIDITLEQMLDMSEDDIDSFLELWNEAASKYNVKFRANDESFEYILDDETLEKAFIVKKNYSMSNITNDVIQEPQPDSKASAAILNFFDSNSNTLIAKLKDSGLQLSAAALQNDQNITRVANVVYNLLPGMVRIFVSFDTVENFLLEHRQWLINKLI